MIVNLGTVDGKAVRKSVTADTKAEAEFKAAVLKNEYRPGKKQPPRNRTLRAAIDDYISLSEVLSPTTIQAYKKIQKYAFPDLMDIQVNRLDDTIVQIAINAECKRKSERTGKPLSAKTVKNEWALVSAALKNCGLSFNIRLPKVQRKNKILPSPEAVYEAIKGTEVELPCLLAMWLSFSMSEIRGLKCSSFRSGYLFVDQVVVDISSIPTEKKNAKTDTRIRKQRVPEYIKQLILKTETYKRYKSTGIDDYLVDMTRNQIYHYYSRRMEAAGISASFHDLRHIFASVMLNELNIPEKIVQDEGGWSTPHVMKSVYSNTFSDSQAKADNRRDAWFESNLIKKKQ